MTGPNNVPAARRSIAARLGIAALNLLGPGVGLLRAGQPRLASIVAGAYMAFAILFIIVLNALPVLSFGMLAAVTLSFLAAMLAVLIGAIVLTWRHSKECSRPARWSRWYAIIAAILLWLAIAPMLQPLIHRAYKPFYAAAESMMPAFVKNDRLVADMRWHAAEVGNIVLVRAPQGEIRIYRIAAIGGQTFAMRDGVPIVDGHPARQRPAGSMTVALSALPPQKAQRIIERLPGEKGAHLILKTWPQEFDDVAPIRIPTGQMMVLGDNRDMAADGRVPVGFGGVGLLTTTAIIGRPLYVTWGSSRPMGQRADH